jgi:hypothetical protein
MKWKLYYTDGSEFSSDDGAWKDAPSDGVQAICVGHPDYGRHVWHSKDYYVEMPDGGIFGTDDLGCFLRALGLVKFGHMTNTDNFKARLEQATQDPTFPRRTP